MVINYKSYGDKVLGVRYGPRSISIQFKICQPDNNNLFDFDLYSQCYV